MAQTYLGDTSFWLEHQDLELPPSSLTESLYIVPEDLDRAHPVIRCFLLAPKVSVSAG
jgi:hypothetical protein